MGSKHTSSAPARASACGAASPTLSCKDSYTALARRCHTGRNHHKKGIHSMQVQVNTSNGIDNKESLEQWANEFLHEQLSRFRQEITRIEVQLSDENALRKGAGDKRCMLEARLNGHEPLAVSH